MKRARGTGPGGGGGGAASVDLDAIFAAGEAKKAEAKEERGRREKEAAAAAREKEAREVARRRKGKEAGEGNAVRTALDDLDDAFKSGKGAKAWVHKQTHTSEGFRVMWEDELGINKPGSGETELCPFDCDCCF